MIMVKLNNPVETGKVIDSNNGSILHDEPIFNHSFIKVDDETFTPIPCLLNKPTKILIMNSSNILLVSVHNSLFLLKEESLTGKPLYQHYYLERKNINIVSVVYPENSIDYKFYTFFCLYHYTNNDDEFKKYFSDEDIRIFRSAVKIYNPSTHILNNGVIYDNKGRVIFELK